MLPRTGHYVPGKRISTQNGLAVLFARNSKSSSSQIFDVRDVPLVVTAFGLRAGETITIWTVYATEEGDTLEQPFLPEGATIQLTQTDNTVVLVYSGRYRAVFTGVLGQLICLTRLQQVDVANTVEVLSQPAGAQANRPNQLLGPTSTSNTSPIIDIWNVPQVITLFTEEDGRKVLVETVYDSGALNAEPFLYNGRRIELSNINNTVLLDKTGRYRFVYDGTIGAATLLTVPQAIQEVSRQTIDITYDDVVDALGYVPARQGEGGGIRGIMVNGEIPVGLMHFSDGQLWYL